ncbi:MAG: TetR family transcriptional regulator [Akkermansia sp.]
MPIRSDGEETKCRILMAAGCVFAEKGFRCATNHDIAQISGANSAAVSYYFRDKAGLYRETWAFFQKRSYEKYAQWLESFECADKQDIVRLKHVMRCIFDWMFDEDSKDSALLSYEVADPTGLLECCREDAVLYPLSAEMERLLSLSLATMEGGSLKIALLVRGYIASIRGLFRHDAPELGAWTKGDIGQSLVDIFMCSLEKMLPPPAKRVKNVAPSPQLELGVTDEVAFELKPVTREEIVMLEEKKAYTEPPVEETPTSRVSLSLSMDEHQLELF